MFRLISRLVLFLLVVFIVPALLHFGVWSSRDMPQSWRQANWSSSGLLPVATADPEARVYVLAARTGGLKGAFATHSWLVLKRKNASQYDRYDVVGWGTPVRRNAYDADGRWYSNEPVIERMISGRDAEKLIPKIEMAIADYRWRRRGDYTLWPGPNSNTFVASIIRAVPGFDARTPVTAVGRDYPVDGRWLQISRNGTVRVSIKGYAGFVVGRDVGLELNFLGLVAGLNPFQGEIKIPGFGSYALWTVT